MGALRAKLILSLCITLLLVGGIAGLYLWSARQAEFYFNQAQSEQAEHLAYMDLTTEIYRFFRRLDDVLLAGEFGETQGDTSALTRMRELLEQLKDMERAEIEIEMELDNRADDVVRKEGERELQRLSEIESLINEGTGVFEAMKATHGALKKNRSLGALRTVVRDKFDGKFPRLIDDALEYERSEAVDLAAGFTTRMQTSAMLALWTLLISIGFILVVGFAVVRNMRALEIVLQGTRKLAEGDLGHRIDLRKRDDLSHVAEKFNTMAAGMERQKTQLLESQANLEQEVRQRTVELEDANRSLKLLDEARRQFFADISHELRTPLTVIRGEAEVSLRGGRKAAGEYEAALGKILELVYQLSDVVSDLLFLARSETATLQVTPRKIALDQLLTDISDVSTTLTQRTDVSIHMMNMDGEDFIVQGDQQGLGRLFLCIVENAVQHSEQGGSIQIMLKRNGQSIVATISDTGPGIPAEEVEHIFERFYRGVRARKIAPSGCGLGLALAKSIVDAHHGEISVTSTRGVGTTVEVQLPYAA